MTKNDKHNMLSVSALLNQVCEKQRFYIALSFVLTKLHMVCNSSITVAMQKPFKTEKLKKSNSMSKSIIMQKSICLMQMTLKE